MTCWVAVATMLSISAVAQIATPAARRMPDPNSITLINNEGTLRTLGMNARGGTEMGKTKWPHGGWPE
jgi:hypothetical protein